jgi:hypothetical protein
MEAKAAVPAAAGKKSRLRMAYIVSTAIDNSGLCLFVYHPELRTQNLTAL